MSNPYSQAYENPQPDQTPSGAPNQSNAMGTAGFVVSLIGLLTCGLLSIFGLVLSLFGLRKNPKGFAIAGAIMGLLGLVELALVGLFAYNAVQAVGTMQTAIYQGVSESIATEIANDVAKEWESTGELPNETDGQSFTEGKTDLFEGGYLYETDGSSFTIRGAGTDLEFNTEDDVTVGPFNNAQEVFDLVAEDDFGIDGMSEQNGMEEGLDDELDLSFDSPIEEESEMDEGQKPLEDIDLDR